MLHQGWHAPRGHENLDRGWSHGHIILVRLQSIIRSMTAAVIIALIRYNIDLIKIEDVPTMDFCADENNTQLLQKKMFTGFMTSMDCRFDDKPSPVFRLQGSIGPPNSPKLS